jgi:hypothetical protein
MTKKTLALAASITMLVAISGLASARTTGSHTRDWHLAAGRSDQQVQNALNGLDPTTATQTVDNNGYRYHGGPKSND